MIISKEVDVNLLSCGSCGVVLDLSRISCDYEMKDEVDEESSQWNREHFHWANDCWAPSIRCPVCKEKISAKDGDEVP